MRPGQLIRHCSYLVAAFDHTRKYLSERTEVIAIAVPSSQVCNGGLSGRRLMQEHRGVVFAPRAGVRRASRAFSNRGSAQASKNRTPDAPANSKHGRQLILGDHTVCIAALSFGTPCAFHSVRVRFAIRRRIHRNSMRWGQPRVPAHNVGCAHARGCRQISRDRRGAQCYRFVDCESSSDKIIASP
jgi:hypothetical protein